MRARTRRGFDACSCAYDSRSHRPARSGQARTRSSMTTLIKRIDHGDVRELRLDRAPVNALNPMVCAQLVEALREAVADRSEEHTSELQSLMRISYAVFCLKKKNNTTQAL